MKSRNGKAISVDIFKELIQAEMIAPEGIVAIVDRLAYGEDVKKDKKKAFLLAQQGMRLKDPYLTWYVADAYEHGAGVKKSLSQALVYYKKAISLNSLEACTGLGVYYWKKARSTKQEKSAQRFYKQAVNLYRKAARRREPYAINNLGLCYEYGEGVPVNSKIAYRFYTKAAALGHDNAMYKAGCCLLNGEGVSKDRQLAAQWLKAASDLGHRGASKLISKRV